jgi:uncharacterized protein YegL
MNRPARIHQRVFVSLTLTCIAAAWWGCSPVPEQHATETSQSSSSGSGGTGGVGGIHLDGGDGGDDDSGACTSIGAAAHRVPLDIVFLIDQSGSMSGPKWIGTSTALTTFFNDPASANIGAGLVFFPRSAWDCVTEHYKTLDVPIDLLPSHAFALTNALPADAKGTGTPTYGAIKGALMAATAHQDAHPTHKVILVLATDGDPNGCADDSIELVADLAKSARNYNGVLTYVIGVAGSTVSNLNKVAAAGGTTAAYDVTSDISQFSAKMAEIRKVALACDFELPPPPMGQQLDPYKVNFSYTPKGTGKPALLPRANDFADCNGQPGWYFDSNTAPTKIILCPASCTTVQNDNSAKVDVLFGCKSVAN